MNAATPERRPVTEEISGLIERVTFHNDESGFCVLRVKTPGHREETTVVGSLPSVTAGEWLVAEGCWVRDREHGLQFKAAMMKTVPPTTAEGIERYLGSGLAEVLRVPQFKVCAKRFMEHFIGFWLCIRCSSHGLFDADDLRALRAPAEPMTGPIHF